ncbi:hypothetical protein PR048_026599 [Dryococelus australis]|uniref:DUF7869 domain-containing protein n=1 Tax=Dryococelus australis TaxID=614101 RepID=A0ABQ9GLT4_9NEOP|nr:hypothetical protein PR048_026599 [Dryococelus australis]
MLEEITIMSSSLRKYNVRYLEKRENVKPVPAIVLKSEHGIKIEGHIARRRPRKPGDQKRKDHSAAFVYKKDQRGKHDNRPMKYPSAIHGIIVQHLQSFHAFSSHYSLRDNPDQEYLPESLTTPEMHEMFLNTCHKKEKEFRTQARAGNIVCLSFDYMQNLPLADLKTNAIFYSYQLWPNVFGIHDLGSDSVTMFAYHEGDGRKGNNEVTSMLLTYINNNNEPLDNLVLIGDSSCGQNKNQTMVHFIFTLVHCFHVFKTVMYLYLVRGHSYSPNDQDFSIIDRKKRHIESVELPEEWDSIIQEARKKPSPFSVVNMRYRNFVNMKATTDDYFFKSPKPPLKIKTTRMLYITEQDFYARVRDTYHGPWQTCTVLKKPMPAVLDLPSLYVTHPPIAPVKTKDLQ